MAKVGDVAKEDKLQVPQATSLFDGIVLQLLTQPLSRKELAKKHGLSTFAGSMNRAITQLLALGFIERTQRNPRAPNQAYRITEKGRGYLEAKEQQQLHKTEKSESGIE